MTLNVFSWLRAKTRDAILGGFADAVTVLDNDGGPIESDLPAALVARFRPALPACETVEEPMATSKRRKAV